MKAPAHRANSSGNSYGGIATATSTNEYKLPDICKLITLHTFIKRCENTVTDKSLQIATACNSLPTQKARNTIQVL